MINVLPSDVLNNGLNSFRNSRDEDIESFLRFKAVEFEKRHWCSTYLLVDVENFQKGILSIDGYFTLSNKVISIPDNLSKLLFLLSEC